MKSKHFQLILIFFLSTSCAFGLKLEYGISAGCNLVSFRPEIYSSSMTFYNYEFQVFKSPIVGFQLGSRITQRKSFCIGMKYTDSKLIYSYTDRLGWSVGPNGSISHNGQIRFQTLLLSTTTQYQALKWLSINYGFAHYIQLKNSFENEAIGSSIGWLDKDGNSNIKPYQIALSLGLEFRLFRTLSLELLHTHGMSKAIILKPEASQSTYTLRLNYSTICLNYTL